MSCSSQDPAYSRLKDHLIESTGLAFYAERDETMTALIGGRLSELGLRDCSDYAQFLAGGVAGSAEMEALVAQLTIGETYFFRGKEQFAAIRDLILPEILERKQSSMELRIWSAGCATGAEPYSLAIMLARDLADRIAGWQISIHATDINRIFLAQAAEGKFRPSALRATSDEVKRACFSNDGRIWTIHPRYKQWISFHYLNLIDGDFSTPLTASTRFDLILCRSVLLYFTPQVRRRMIGQFHQSLGEEGWLVVGAAESDLESYKVFKAVNAVGAMLYQKSASPRGQREAAPQMASNTPTHAMVAVQSTPRPPAGPITPDMEGLRQLADSGDWQHAAEYGRRLLILDSLNPEIHFYTALILEHLGIMDESERALRHAIYLDRHFALAHYHLGLALKRAGQWHGAELSFENVMKTLAGMADGAMVTAGPGVTVTGLKDLARMHLESSREK